MLYLIHHFWSNASERDFRLKIARTELCFSSNTQNTTFTSTPRAMFFAQVSSINRFVEHWLSPNKTWSLLCRWLWGVCCNVLHSADWLFARAKCLLIRSEMSDILCRSGTRQLFIRKSLCYQAHADLTMSSVYILQSWRFNFHSWCAPMKCDSTR